MITFRQHLEISQNSNREGGILNYISNLPPEERVRATRGITETYPLKMGGEISEDLKNCFNVYDNVMDLVLGQFIMIEQIITGKTKFDTDAENDLAIVELILRPKHHNTFDNENLKDEEDNKKKILDTPVQKVYDALAAFIEDRDFVLFKQFAGVFYDVSEEEEESEDEEKTSSQQLFSQQWYWYSMVRMLAKEDITRYSDIYMLKMSTVMPEMSFLAQKSKIESAEQRQQQAMRKL
jgi:hypothetical protein